MKKQLRITASRVPGLLGVNKWQSVSEAVAETVASAAGLRWDNDNEIFAYGRENEPRAIADLELILAEKDPQAKILFTGKNQKWFEVEKDGMILGCYPDGLAEVGGKRYLVEIKCPFSKKEKKLSETHYKDQIYFQLFLANHFTVPLSLNEEDVLAVDGFIYFCWVNSGDEQPEIVEVKQEEILAWWERVLPTLKNRWVEMLAALADENELMKYCQSFHSLKRTNKDVAEFLKLDEQLKALQKKRQEVGKRLWGSEKNIAFYKGKEVLLATIYAPTRAIDRKSLNADLFAALSFLKEAPADLQARFRLGASAYENLSWSRRIKLPGGKMSKEEAEAHTLEQFQNQEKK